MEELQGILERVAGSGWELIALPSRRWLDGQENREELVRALQRAQQICGTRFLKEDLSIKVKNMPL